MNSPAPSQRIGLIGVGLLGAAIVDRLADQGIDVIAFDVNTDRRALVAGKCEFVTTQNEVFDRCDTIILSLPTSSIGHDVLSQATLQRDQLVIDTTTGVPDEMIALDGIVNSHGAHYAEATVAGSSVQMREGRAVVFVGCGPSVHARVQQVVGLLTSKAFRLGEVGAASRFKLVHNMILGLHRAVLAEGLTFADALGFDMAQTLEILEQTPAVSGVMATKGRKMVDDDFSTQARLSQHLKDVRIMLELAEQLSSNTPLTKVHRDLLEDAETRGYGDSDNSAVVKAYQQASNIGNEADQPEP